MDIKLAGISGAFSLSSGIFYATPSTHNPPIPPTRCLLTGNNLLPTTIICRAPRAITSNAHSPPFPRRLPGWGRNIILNPRFARLPPPRTAMLNHCVPSNRFRRPRRRKTLRPHRGRKHRAQKRILRARNSTNLSRIHPVNPISPRPFAQG